MIALTRAELVKLRSTRVLCWLLVGTLAMVLMTVAASVPSNASANTPTSLDDPALLARMVGVSVLWPQLTVALLGVLTHTQEERHGTITSTRLVEPRPHRVFAAKASALVLAGGVIAITMLGVSTAATTTLIRTRHGNATVGAEFWEVTAAACAVLALSALIGLGVGTLVRNQIVAVTVVLVWLTAGEHLLIEALPQIGRWTPVGATAAFLQLGPEATSGTLLDAAVGGLLLGGYTALAGIVALVVPPRRDVL